MSKYPVPNLYTTDMLPSKRFLVSSFKDGHILMAVAVARNELYMELAPNYSAETALSYGCKQNDVMQCNLCVVGMRIRSHYSGISMTRGYWYLHFLYDKGIVPLLWYDIHIKLFAARKHISWFMRRI